MIIVKIVHEGVIFTIDLPLKASMVQQNDTLDPTSNSAPNDQTKNSKSKINKQVTQQAQNMSQNPTVFMQKYISMFR